MESRASVHWHGGGGWSRFHGRDTVFHCPLHLLEGANLNLAYALPGNPEFRGELLQRYGVVRQTPRFKDAAFAIVQH